MQARPYGGTTYFGKAQLEATNASRKEGIDAVAEARWRSTTSKLVKAAIKTLKLPDWVYETSMNYINRFFLTRSISKNDRHLVVGGAILLAGKVQESPRSVQDIAYVLLQLKYANKHKQQLPRPVPDQTALEQFMEGVVLAEQAMLFSLNFNLNVETHVSLARRLLEPLDLWAKANPPPEEAEANQLKLSLYSAVMFFLNDSASTNLSLQYPSSMVAPVTLIMAAKRIAAARYAGKEVPAALQRVLALAADAEWHDAKGLTLETAADIEAQINELYATAPAQPAAQQQHAAAQAQQQRQQLAPAARPQQAPPVPNAVPAPAPAAAAAAASLALDDAADSRGAGGEACGAPSAGQQPQQRAACKRVSDGDECCAGGDEHATSELQAEPGPRPEAAEVGAAGPGCRESSVLGDSANHYCSPNGLTNGDASNSGGGHVEGQAEVCSRADAPDSRQQQLPGACLNGDAPTQHQQQRLKRCRSEDGEAAGDEDGECVADGDSAPAPVAKAPRLEQPEGVVA
ncbi:Cyclin-M-1 [Tetrabaena socialis]|uniref:Cyclin-M-1 n=1 Tax=Tetrabaena socialis TaxID=47790 RepID=A0A2J7ZWR8_9CHLO|nr:Cyclin-M-1 [Tetrabaena socialis]|eukprot:PNH04706.1 Cyclin-M-1 [Tetrabaena socialis]